jgi:hypothetical protein
MISLSHDIETLHILLEHFYDSQRNENAAQLADFVGRQPVARSQDLFCPLRQFQRRGWRRRIGCTPRRIRAASCRVSVVILARSTRETGRKPYPRCLAGGSSDRTVLLWDWPPTVQSAPRRLVTRQLGGRIAATHRDASARSVPSGAFIGARSFGRHCHPEVVGCSGDDACRQPAGQLDYRLCCMPRTMRISRTPPSTWAIPSARKPCLR